MVYLCTKFDDFAVIVSEISLGTAKFKMSHVTLTTPPLIVIFVPYAGKNADARVENNDMAYPCTKFDHYTIASAIPEMCWCRPKFKWFT